jgi:hypothetical protein
MLFLGIVSPIRSQYVMVTGNSESGIFDVLNMDWYGSLSRRSSFDTWDDTLYYGDPWDIVVSPKGNYMFSYDWGLNYGVLYSIDADYGFHFIREFYDAYGIGCGGGAFTTDEEYLFSSVPIRYPQFGAAMQTWKLGPSSCDLRTSQTVPKQHILMENFVCSSLDEVAGCTLFGSAGVNEAFAAYQFDRVQERLVYRQTIPDVYCLFSTMAFEDKFIAYAWRDKVGTIVRDANGTYTLCSTYSNASWAAATSSGWGICVTPDRKFAVSTLSGGPTQPNGAVLFSVTEASELVYRQLVTKSGLGTEFLTMTPDGRYFVVGHIREHIGYNTGALTVYRINPDIPALEEVSTMEPAPLAVGPKFLPQAIATRPTTAEGPWQLYSSAETSGPLRHNALKDAVLAQPLGNREQGSR